MRFGADEGEPVRQPGGLPREVTRERADIRRSYQGDGCS